MTTTRLVDLHVHTNYSDGTFTPAEAVAYAKQVGLTAISITDHDTVAAMPEALAEGAARGIEVIPGIELSAEIGDVQTTEMHILGYCINGESAQFRESLELFRTARTQRAFKILEKLKKLGIALDEKRLFEISGRGVVGRLHFAKAMIEGGFAGNIGEAFQRYLGIGRPAFVPKLRLKPEEAIRMILRTGGIPVLAHPYYGHYSNRNLLRRLVGEGLKGIEVWHSKHPPQSVRTFEQIARELGLLSTGGSDCHGSFGGEPPIMGTVKISYDVVEALKNCKEKMDRGNTQIFEDAG
jgi:predicted metal-dependent phosphoesterase TrpH